MAVTRVFRPQAAVTLVSNLPNVSGGTGSGSANAGVVGAAPQWADGSDATYARVLAFNGVGTDYATVPFPSIPVPASQIVSASLSIRISTPGDVATKANFRIAKTDGTGLVGDADSTLLPSGNLPAGDVPVTITNIPLDYGDPIADVLTQSDLAIYMWPSGGANKDLKIYEVTVTVVITGTIKSVVPDSGLKVIEYTADPVDTTPTTVSSQPQWGVPTSTDPDPTSYPGADPWPTTVVGGDSALLDGLDTTYVVTQRQIQSGWSASQIVNFPISTSLAATDITTISYSLRAKVDKTGGPADGPGPHIMFAQDPDFVGGVFRIPNDAAYVYDGTTFEFSHTLTTADEATSGGSTLADVKNWLASGTGVLAILGPQQDSAAPAGSAYTQTLYEFVITLESNTGPPVVIANVLTLKGPSTPAQGDSEKHRGMFAIDPTTGTASGRTKIGTTDTDIWVSPVIEFFEVASDGTTVPMGVSTFRAVPVPASPQWREINIFGETPENATHYAVQIKMFADSALATPLPGGTRVYYDSIFVPESGYDLRSDTQPYLDGDQSFGIWEGTPQDSTSIYGQKPPTNLDLMTLIDDDLTVPYY